ncbi:hypothetical protein [Lucifera butyrica]|nr:hypothetical protein [Lucifera butyrica]
MEKTTEQPELAEKAPEPHANILQNTQKNWDDEKILQSAMMFMRGE